jgi:hypothetical protein
MRWLGTLTIGGIAMRVSWVHLNELMASRGQKGDVSALGPLAIDCLAIMATALLLAGRRTVSKDEDMTVQDMDTYVASAQQYAVSGLQDMPTPRWANLDDDIQPTDTGWTLQETDLFARLEAELDSTTTPAAPVVTGELPVRRRQAVRGVVNEPEALEYAETGRAHGLKAGEIAELLAGWYGVHSRTIRRIAGWSVAVA